MATTNTVTSPYAGQTVYSFTELANGDTFDIDTSSAKEILFQVTAGTFNNSTLALVGSLNGTNWAPLYQRNAIAIAAIPASSISATAVNLIVFDVQPTRFARIQVTKPSGTDGTGIQCTLILRTL